MTREGDLEGQGAEQAAACGAVAAEAGTAAAAASSGAAVASADPPAPLVSVIVPAYNVEEYVGQAVRSILGQTMGDLELIVVDDGSTDATGTILDGLAAGDARMRVLHVQNGGAPAARNRALDVARGRYVAFADADDECAPTYLEELCRLMEDGCELAICGFTIVTTGGYGEGADAGPGTGSGARAQSFTEVKSVPSAVYATAEEFRAASPELFDNNQLYSPWNKMYSRERLDRLGIRFKDVFWDDFPFVLDYIRDVERVSVTSEPLYTFYRRRADSETARYREGVFEKRETEDGWMRELYAHWGMAKDPVADEMVSRRYVERLVGCVANEASPANPKSFGQKRAAVKGMLASPALGHALATARPRSVKMRIMLLPYRARNATACLLFAMFINWVRTKAPALFARLKAHR